MKEFICIVCPNGCNIVYQDDGTITGYKCKRGLTYVTTEVTNPVRTITSTVKTDKGERCPVRTNTAIPKDKMFEVMGVVRNTVATTPVKVGDVLVENICDTGANLVATSNL